MKPFFLSLLIIAGLTIAVVSYAAPTVRYEQHIYPFFDSAFDLGTSTKAWSGFTVDKIWSTTLSGSGTKCLQADNNGLIALASGACGSGSGGGGGLASTSPWVANTWVYAIDDASVGASSTPYFSAFTGTSATTTNFAITGLTGSIPYSNAIGSLQPLLIGSNLSLSNGTLSATGGSSFAFPFTKLSTNEQATSTTLSLLAGLTSASSTFTGDVTIVPMTSALLQTGAGGLIAEYAGTSCTNQFPRSLSALGVATCASVANTDLTNSTISGIALGSNLADLTALNTSLTFSGSYNGSTARTVGLNVGNANVWTALQTFTNSSSTLLSSTIASTSQLMLSGKKDALLSVDANGWVVATSTIGANQTDTSIARSATTITVAGTANQITSSAGAQDLSTNRTWTLSIPTDFRIASTTITGGTLMENGTSTNFHISNQFLFGGVRGDTWDDYCVSITGSAGLCDGDDGGGAGGGISWPFTKQGDGFQATSTGILLSGGLVVSGTASTTFQQPIHAPNVATTTMVSADYCAPNPNPVHGALGGNAFFSGADMTNDVSTIVPLQFLTGTTSQATCLFIIPHSTASTTITTFYTSTSTTAAHNYAMDLSVYTFDPKSGSYDPTDGVKTWLLSGSTTPSQRMAVSGTALGGNGTTTSTSLSMAKGSLLYVIYDAYLADADDTASSDFMLPINPTIEIQL